MGLKDNLKELARLRRELGMLRDTDAFRQRVRRARKGRGMTLEELASATGMAKSYLSQIETGAASPPRDDKVRRIAAALGLDEVELVSLARHAQLPDEMRERMARLATIFDMTEERIQNLLEVQALRESADAAPVDLDALHRSGLLEKLAAWGEPAPPARLRRVPIINKVSAGYSVEFTDLDYPVGVADEYIAVPVDLGDPHAFAVRVVGDSMEPRYHEGDVVILSPAETIQSGDDCFVRFAPEVRRKGNEATFKRVFFDAEDAVRLQPLNESYPPDVVGPAEIAGIYRAVARYEKLERK